VSVKEFDHIEITLVRNPDWLKIREKKGFFLSEDFPLGEYKLPIDFESMTESDIDRLIAYLKDKIKLTQKELEK
jgi:hypothetical protein